MEVQADFSELFALSGALAAAPNVTRVGVSYAVVGSALDIQRTAKSLAPRRSNRLANSIQATGPNGGRLQPGRTLEAEVGPTVFYGHMVEGGTSEHAPQPFMGPALDQHQPALEERIANVADGALR